MDKVKLRPLERAELNDTLALSDLVYEYTERLLGGILASGDVTDSTRGGALSFVNTTYNASNGTLAFATFQFLETTLGGAALVQNDEAAPEARIIRFNSADSNHINSPLDISASRSVGTTYQVYVRSITVETDTDFRRTWDLNTQQEVSAAMTTRRRQRCEFIVGKNEVRPSESTTEGIGAWVHILSYSVNISGDLTPVVEWAWDDVDEKTLDFVSSANIENARVSSNALTALANEGSSAIGILNHLSAFKLLSYLMNFKGSEDQNHTIAANANWLSRPRYSLAEIAARLDTLRTDVNTNETDLEALDTATSGSQRIEYITAVVHAVKGNLTDPTSTFDITINYHNPANLNFQLLFDAHEIYTAYSNDSEITDFEDIKKYLAYPVLEINSVDYFAAYLVQCNVVPNVGAATSPAARNSMINNTATIEETPHNLQWAYRAPYAVPAPNDFRYNQLLQREFTNFAGNRVTTTAGAMLALDLNNVALNGQSEYRISYTIQFAVQRNA